jgi:hypothetical protein
MVDIEKQSTITFEIVHSKQINIIRNGKKVGEIWSWKPAENDFDNDIYPYSEEKKDYTSKNSIQICGFSKNSKTWSCGEFEGKRDIVLTFDNLKYSEFEEETEYDKGLREQFEQDYKYDMEKQFEQDQDDKKFGRI